MKSQRKYRFWFTSLAVHLCLAMGSSIIINQTTPSNVYAFDASIFKIEQVPPVKKTPRIEAPPIAPTPTPDFQIERQPTSAQTRTLIAHPVRSASVSVPKTVRMDVQVSQSPTQDSYWFC